jgi:hypothetical protein
MSRLTLLVLAVALAIPAGAQPPKPVDPPAKSAPWFVDDTKYYDDFADKAIDLAKAGKCLAHDKLLAKMKSGTKAKLTPPKPGTKALSPEEVYKLALPSVFLVGSVYKDDDGDWVDGLYATAWVVGADGVLVTNWHTFEDLEPGEVFAAVDHKGNVYPMTDFLGGDKVADVAVFRIDAKGLAPLAISPDYPEVGSWVGLLGHPGDNFYVYTTGHVTRYSTNKNDDGRRERWMGITAEYAGGSSGSPVLDKYGSVVGMAALTLTLDDGGGIFNRAPGRKRLLLGQPPKHRLVKAKAQPPVAPPPREKPGPKNPKPDDKPAPPVLTEMVLKMTVPGPTILRSFGK